MNIGVPQGIWLGFIILGFGIVLSKHGEPRGPYSVWDYLVNSIISLGLLYWGGFFT